MQNPKNKAIFFDRDGVVNLRIVGEYVQSYDDFRFCPDFFKFFKFIKSQGYLAIIITNQQGIGKGLMSEDDLSFLHSKMQTDIENATGFKFDDIYFCGSLSTQRCSRRKPNPGMILEAVEKWNIDKNYSWIVGDSLSDIIAGEKAEIGTIYLGQHLANPFINPNYQFRNFYQLEANFDKIRNFNPPFIKPFDGLKV